MKRQNSITLLDFSNFLRAGAFLRYENDWILAWGSPHSIARPKSEEISVFCPSFYEVEEGKACHFPNEARLSRLDFLKLCREYLETHPEPHFSWERFTWVEPDQGDFSKSFSQIQQMISQGQIEKAVPCVFAKTPGSLSPFAMVKCFVDLLETPEAMFAYGFWTEGEGLLGATPEILFEKKDLHLRTMALAGTLPKSIQADANQLLKDKKELSENRFVVQDLSAQLTPLGRVRVQAPRVLELPTLWHLITDMEVDLEEDVEVVDLVKRLHPTPALGVAPRRFGWRWMREWPQQNLRQRFGSPFLMRVDEGHWICLVAIRNLQWTRNEMYIGSGCGVVKESDLEREWLELFYKRESVKKILGIKK